MMRNPRDCRACGSAFAPRDTFTRFEQPEAFWLELEAEYRTRAGAARANRLPPGAEHVDCPRCNGTGKVTAASFAGGEVRP